jgi:hypothetical protein
MTEYSLAWKFWQESAGRANAVRGSFDCNASALDYNESYRTHRVIVIAMIIVMETLFVTPNQF